ERLNKNLFLGKPLAEQAHDVVSGRIIDGKLTVVVRKRQRETASILDLNSDGYVDLVICDSSKGGLHLTRLWSMEKKMWEEIKFPINVLDQGPLGFGFFEDNVSHFGNLKYDFNGKEWKLAQKWEKLLFGIPRVLDLDNDGKCEVIFHDRIL